MTTKATFIDAVVSEVKGDLLQQRQETSPSRIVRAWTEGEEGNLIAGSSMFGVGNWEAIRQDPACNLTERSAMQLNEKWRALVKDGHVISEDFPTHADVYRRRRTEGLLALPPSEHHRRLPNSNRFTETTENWKKRRISSPESASSCNCSLPTSSRHESAWGKSRRGIQTSPCDGPAVISAAVLQAIAKVEIAKDYAREALLIQSDANAVASKAMAALTHPGGNPLTKREAAISASSFASLAQAKSLKSRAILGKALTNLSKVQNATRTGRPSMELSEADNDTANSSCKSAQHDSRSSERSGTSLLEVPASDTCGSSVSMRAYLEEWSTAHQGKETT